MHLLADNVLYLSRLLCFGRFLVGLGIGISAVVVPVYLGEVAPAQVTLHPTACTAQHEKEQQAYLSLSCSTMFLANLTFSPCVFQHLSCCLKYACLSVKLL